MGRKGKPISFEKVWVKGGNIPSEYIPSCDKGFQTAMKKGSLLGFPVVNVKMTVVDGAAHSVDSSDQAFQTGPAFDWGFRGSL